MCVCVGPEKCGIIQIKNLKEDTYASPGVFSI